jgi:preprotein translocase subunit SecG
MYTFFIAIEILVSIFLMIAVLMQASKGGGLAGTLGSSNFGTVFGVRRTSDFLTRITTILATAFMVLALFINLVILPRAERTQESVIQSGPQPSALPPTQQPVQQPAQQQPAQQQPAPQQKPANK